MKERPILFSAPLVQAILNGRKTQTRRLCKTPIEVPRGFSGASRSRLEAWDKILDKCPYGQIGDRLWVRETFLQSPDGAFWYRADKGEADLAVIYDYKWKSSIFMPRKASRILLEITKIRVERLQDILPKDIQAEGIEVLERDRVCDPLENASIYLDQWIMLWDKINRKKAPWCSNPWVWVIDFRRS